MKRKLKELCLLVVGALLLVLTGSATQSEGMAGSVNVGVNLPDVRFSAPPEVVVIPGTYVYMVPDVDVDIMFYQGYWWRPYEGRWYRSSDYNGGWSYIGSRRIPNGLRELPNDYRHRISSRHNRIPHREVTRNWRKWEEEKYWDRRDENDRDRRYEQDNRRRGDQGRDGNDDQGRYGDQDNRSRGGHSEAREGSVNVGFNLPAVRFSAPPDMVVIPGTYVYMVPDVDVDIMFYQDYWWRPYEGRWYRSRDYKSGWKHIGPRNIPSGLRELPKDYRHRISSKHKRIPHNDVQKNWRKWEKEKHWDRRDENDRDGRDEQDNRSRGDQGRDSHDGRRDPGDHR